jgi:protein-tyrosine phosphatase
MAHVVLEAKIADSPLAGAVEVDSSGTGDWHIGDSMDPRAAATLAGAGYDPRRHRAQKFDRRWFADFDVVIVMDSGNLRDVHTEAADDDSQDRMRMLRNFDVEANGDLDVPDPWYGGQSGFDDTLAIIERSTDGLIDALKGLLARRLR